MIPTVFSIAFGAFPPEKRMVSSLIMSMIVSLAPTIGPTLGGYLTEAASWRWLFFINVPPGLLVLFLVWRYGDFDKGDRSLAKGFDLPGLILMAVFLMGTQYVLEEGARDNWFEDAVILWLAVAATLAGAAFIWRQLVYSNPIVQVRAFGDRNFVIGCLLTFVSGVGLFGGTFLIPQYLATIRGYSSVQIGEAMIISGVVMLISGPIAGRLAQALDARIQMFVGFSIAGAGFWLGHAMTDQWGFWEFALMQALRSFGIMLAMLSTQNVTMATLNPELLKSASGLVNLFRNVGGAFGLAMITTVLGQGRAAHTDEISSSISVSDVQAQGMMAGLVERMTQMGVADPEGAAYKAMSGMIQRQAMTLTFADAFAWVAVACFAAALIALLGSPKTPTQLAAAGARAASAEPAH
jgi:DHA2 family multidrug resistance protein